MTSTPAFCAMVLSAGFGTRLRPLTDEIPKPLVPIGDTPLLGRLLARLSSAGAKKLVVNVHHHAERIESYLNTLELSVHVSREERILGTAGGIARARDVFEGGPVVIANGDIVGEPPIMALLKRADEGLVMALSERAVGKGTVGLGTDGSVVRLRGELFGKEVASGDYMGVAALGATCLNSLPDEGCLVGDWALPHLRAGGRVQTVVVAHSFQDVGAPADYLAANLHWLALRGGASNFSYVGQGVVMEAGVELVSSVVGAEAHLAGSGRIENSVILPGARALAPLSQAIVTPAGIVIPGGRRTDSPS